jgi:hypothetical protein
MSRRLAFSGPADGSSGDGRGTKIFAFVWKTWGRVIRRVAILPPLMLAASAGAVILWNDPDTTLVRDTGAGMDILGGAVKRDDSANDTLYFRGCPR